MAESRTPAGGVAPQFTVRRDGDAPLKFCGTILAEGDSAQRNGQDSTRWHETTIYQTVGGKYVVAIAFRTRWKGEGDVELASVCDSPKGVILALREYDPVPAGIGFPPGEQFEAKQQRLLADLRGRWGGLVSSLLADCGFSERVE